MSNGVVNVNVQGSSLAADQKQSLTVADPNKAENDEEDFVSFGGNQDSEGESEGSKLITLDMKYHAMIGDMHKKKVLDVMSGMNVAKDVESEVPSKEPKIDQPLQQ
jgi:hypothetical protein